jgi:hypothetical protein
MADGQSTPPEAFPNILQDALYSDDYEMQAAELQAFDKLIATAQRWDAMMKKTREAFAAAGGLTERTDAGVRFLLHGQEIFVSPDEYKAVFRPKPPKKERKLLLAVVRAELCQYDPEKAISNLKIGRDRMLNIHLIRGTKKLADAALTISATLDELARGQLIWEEDEDREKGKGSGRDAPK